MIAFAAMAWLASLDKSATVDEPGHLLGGWTQRQFHDFRFDCEEPALFETIVGLGLPANLFHIDRNSSAWQSLLINADVSAPMATQALYHTPGVDADTLLRTEHARMVALAALIGIVIGWWAWRVSGPVAGIIAMAAFCFDPNFLGHAPLVKNDVLLALSLLLFAASVWMLGERATLPRLAAVCLFIGLSIGVKFSGSLAAPILAIALLARSIIPVPWRCGPFVAGGVARRLAVSAGIFSVAVLFAWLFIWAIYDFRFLSSPDSSDQFNFSNNLRYMSNHQAFAQSADPTQLNAAALEDFWRHWRPPMSVRLVLFANAHRLLPQSYLAGLLRIDAVSQARVAFLCGKSSVTGWWYYFPLAMMFKTPAATLIGLVAAAVWMVPKIRGLKLDRLWPLVACILPPAIYMAVAMASDVNVGIRHIFPVYPFLFIFLGIAAASTWRSTKRAGRFIVALLTIALAAETGFAYPNFISFFNVFAGGSRGGLRLLSESNIDWGQDLPALAAWQSRNPDRPIYLLYWGSADPRYYGIHYVNLPGSTAPADEAAITRGRPVYAISAVVLTNPFVHRSMEDLFDVISREEPLAVLNGSIYIYDAQ